MIYPKRAVDEWKDIHKALMAADKVKDLEKLRWFLGIEVTRDLETRQMWLTQEISLHGRSSISSQPRSK